MTKTVAKEIAEIAKKFGVVGRHDEMEALLLCIAAEKHVLLEGPVGVGKTFLVAAVAHYLGRGVIRVDGDSRYTEQKLTGWFDPPTVLKKGYAREAYFDGPLSKALRDGSILFINELNRMPEGVQNVLLPALDERRVDIPRVGELPAAAGFSVIATQNPKEFVATSHLSEALLDRFELITLDYQSEAEERGIVKNSTATTGSAANETLLDWTIALVRGTRTSSLYRRGASIRAGISIYDIATKMGGRLEDFRKAALLALPTRVELSEEGSEFGIQQAIETSLDFVKKKR